MARSKALFAVAAVLLCALGLSYAQEPCVTSYQSAARNDELTYVAQAMEVTGLSTTFNNTALKATIFLPKNEAFNNLFASLGFTANQVLNTSSPFIPYLGQILEYHVIPSQVIYAANFTQGEVLTSVINETLTVGLNPLTITPTGGKAAAVTFTDFIACAAIEHVLDTVLLPKSVIQAYTAAQGAAAPTVVTKTPVLPAIALPPVAVTTVTPVTVPLVTAAAPVPAAVAPMVQSAAGPDVISSSVAVSFAAAPAMSPIPAMPAAAPYVSTTTTVAPVLPAVTATTETPATVQTPVLSAVTQPIEDKEAQVVAAATPVVFQVQSQVDALKQKVKPTPVIVTPVQTPPVPVHVSGLAVSAPPPPAVVLDKKADLLSTLKDKLLPAAAPPPPAPIAISGAPLSTTSVVKPKNLTALQLPQLDIPVPEKPQIDLPSVPAVPVYQFQLPDIKTELESAVLPVVDKAKSLLPQGSPPPPVQISGTAISGAPITVPPPLPSVIDIPVLPPKKKPFFLLKKKTPLALVDKLKDKLLAPALTQVALTPPPAMPVSGGVSGISGVSGIDQQPAGLPKALTLAIPQDAAAPIEFTLPPLPAVQLPEKDLADKSLPHYSKKKDGPLVIHAPILDGLSSNSVTSTVSSVVTPNDYTITQPSGYASASGSATAGSALSSTTVTAQAGPTAVPTLPNTNATVYNSSATCATVPKTAQMVPDMTDFLAGLQVTGLDTKLNDPTARMTVFVPINSAFDVLAQQLNSSVPALLTQTDMLAQILEYHVIPGMSLSSSNLTDGQVLQTMLAGQSITVQKSGNAIKLLSSDSETSATIVYPDVRACNAIIQVIDTVLSPAASGAAAAAPTAAQAAPVLPAIALQATTTQPAAAAGGR